MLWDCQSGDKIGICCQCPTRTRVVCSPDGRWLAPAASRNISFGRGLVEALRARPFQAIQTPYYAMFMAFSPDSRLTALADSARNIRLIETSNGRRRPPLWKLPDATSYFWSVIQSRWKSIGRLGMDQQLSALGLAIVERGAAPDGPRLGSATPIQSRLPLLPWLLKRASIPLLLPSMSFASEHSATGPGHRAESHRLDPVL